MEINGKFALRQIESLVFVCAHIHSIQCHTRNGSATLIVYLLHYYVIILVLLFFPLLFFSFLWPSFLSAFLCFSFFFSLSSLHFFLIFIMIFKSTFNIDDTENGINHERSTFYFAFSQYCQMILIQFLFLPHASFINGNKSYNEFDTENWHDYIPKLMWILVCLKHLW